MLLKETDRQLKGKDEEIEKLRSRIVWLERQHSEMLQRRIETETLIKSPEAEAAPEDKNQLES